MAKVLDSVFFASLAKPLAPFAVKSVRLKRAVKNFAPFEAIRWQQVN